MQGFNDVASGTRHRDGVVSKKAPPSWMEKTYAADAAWRKDCPPFFPKIVNIECVHARFDAFKTEFRCHLDDAIGHFLLRHPENAAIGPVESWRWTLMASKYGAIYWIDRRKAAQISEQALERAPMLQRMADALAADNGVNRIFNHAVCAWVHAKPERRKYSRIRLPRNGIMSASGDAIYVNRRDFELQTPETAYDCADALYDLHDFVHHVCAWISPELYGCKYFDLFARFDSELQGLVRDSRHAGDAPNPYGDSLMFRQLSLALFDAMQKGNASDRRIVESIADDLARYLRGEVALLQPSTGRTLSVPEMLGPVQLAVLSENKAYEHTASECEEFMFVRGGAGAIADEFSGMTTVERISAIAEAPLGYFERRNFLRHRAQKRAYLLHALYLLESGLVDDVERELLADIIDNLTFADHVSRRRVDLFERVSAWSAGASRNDSGAGISNLRVCA